MSAVARKCISDAARKRWAALRASKPESASPKASKKSAVLAAVTPSAEECGIQSEDVRCDEKGVGEAEESVEEECGVTVEIKLNLPSFVGDKFTAQPLTEWCYGLL